MQDTILEASVGVHEKYQGVEWGGRMNVEKEKSFQEIDLRDRRRLFPELPWGCVQ